MRQHELHLDLIAIAFEPGRPKPYRWHTRDVPRTLKKFESWVRTAYPFVEYVNYYRAGKYCGRVVLIEKKAVHCEYATTPVKKYEKVMRDPVYRCMQFNSLY